MNMCRLTLLLALSAFAAIAFAISPAWAQSAGLVISSDTLNFDRIRGGEFGQATVTLTNTTSASISGTVEEPTGVFRVVSGGGGFTLGAGDSLQVTLEFTPSAVLDFSDSLVISYTIGDSAYAAVIHLLGRGVYPGPITIDVVPDVLIFGTVTVGDTASLTLRIVNTSDSARVHGTIEAMAGPFHTEGGADVTFSLAAGDTEEVTVYFAPTAAIVYTDSLELTYGWGDSTRAVTVAMSGAGIVEAGMDSVTFVVTPAELNFGGVRIGTTQTRSIYITNTSDTAQLIGTVVALNGSFTAVAGVGPFSLGVGETREVAITFAPTSIALQSDSLMFIYLNGSLGLDTAWVRISGHGTLTVSPAASVLVRPEVVFFGNVQVGDTGLRTITILNTSDTATINGSIMATAPGSMFTVTSGSGSFSLAAGQSHTFTVVFAPGASGVFSDSLMVVYDASTLLQPTTVYFAGAGVEVVAGVLVASPATVNFGTVSVGGTYQSQFTLTNTSQDTVRGMILNPAAPFFINGAAGFFELAAGESRTVTVYFTPLLAGSFTDNVVVTFLSGDSAGTLVISLTGSASITTGISDDLSGARTLRLSAFPQPTDGDLTVRFTNPVSGHVRVAVFDTRGREVARLIDDTRTEGEHTASWSAHGQATGVYMLRVQTPGGTAVERIAVAR